MGFTTLFRWTFYLNETVFLVAMVLLVAILLWLFPLVCVPPCVCLCGGRIAGWLEEQHSTSLGGYTSHDQMMHRSHVMEIPCFSQWGTSVRGNPTTNNTKMRLGHVDSLVLANELVAATGRHLTVDSNSFVVKEMLMKQNRWRKVSIHYEWTTVR